MLCNSCGSQMSEEARFCGQCGAASAPSEDPCQCQQGCACPPPPADAPHKGVNVLSFFFPLVGFIVYALTHAQSPAKAKAALKWAIIGMCVCLVAAVLCGIGLGATLAAMAMEEGLPAML